MEATKSEKDCLVSIAMTLHNNDGEYVKSDEEPTDWLCRQRALVKKTSFHENVESRCDCHKGLKWWAVVLRVIAEWLPGFFVFFCGNSIDKQDLMW